MAGDPCGRFQAPVSCDTRFHDRTRDPWAFSRHPVGSYVFVTGDRCDRFQAPVCCKTRFHDRTRVR